MTDDIRKALELLPCPFCGGRAELKEGVHTQYVMCLSCEVMGPNLKDKAELIAAWNRRAREAWEGASGVEAFDPKRHVFVPSGDEPGFCDECNRPKDDHTSPLAYADTSEPSQPNIQNTSQAPSPWATSATFEEWQEAESNRYADAIKVLPLSSGRIAILGPRNELFKFVDTWAEVCHHATDVRTAFVYRPNLIERPSTAFKPTIDVDL